MEERRRLERFDLQASAKLLVEGDGGRPDTLSYITKDISSSGAYIETNQPLELGVPVKLELLLSLDTLQRILGEGGKARVKVKGTVIRSDDRGMAIHFDSRFKIQAVSG